MEILKDIKRGFGIGLGIALFFAMVFGFAYAVGLHSPSEILGGTFVGDYVFTGGIKFENDVNLTSANVIGMDNSMVIENRTSDPASPANGQIWLRTDI